MQIEANKPSLRVRDEAPAEGPICNVAGYLAQAAAHSPDQPAVVVTKSRDGQGRAVYESLSFAELEALSNRYANGLIQTGIARGMRSLLMVRPGVEFVGLTFALFKIGAVPVMIDPGMGVSRLVECIRSVSPEAMIAVPIAHMIRQLKPASFRSVRHAITAGRGWAWGGKQLVHLAERASDSFTPAPTRADETAAILFTSGATGPAKGVVYEHGMFDAQIHAIRSCYDISPGEVDLPAFPLFALFNPALGMTSVIPDMNPSRPARANPARIIELIQAHRVTNSFGSPALWSRVAAYAIERDITLPSLKRVLIAGAPVSPRLIESMHRVLGDHADVHTPYGATEALPVTTMSGRELLNGLAERTRSGEGTCVGKGLPGMDVRVIGIRDEPIAARSDELELHDGHIGEIVVRGPVVTKAYADLPSATLAAKIPDADAIWHRMGDVGYLDAEGRLWYCGRKGHRVVTSHGTLFTDPCEAIFNEHPHVGRSALVGIGDKGQQEPVIIIEPASKRVPRGRRADQMREDILTWGARFEQTRPIRTLLFHRDLPVDVRHNAKINRELLAVWTGRKLP